METYPTPGHACLPARKLRPGQRSRQRELRPEHCGRTLRSHPLLPLGCEKDHPGPMEPKPLDGPKQVGGCRGCLVPPALGADALEMASLPPPPIPVPVLSQQVGCFSRVLEPRWPAQRQRKLGAGGHPEAPCAGLSLAPHGMGCRLGAPGEEAGPGPGEVSEPLLLKWGGGRGAGTLQETVQSQGVEMSTHT